MAHVRREDARAPEELREFRDQAAKERAQGLPVAPAMAALDTPLAEARLQSSFVANIVLPLWARLGELLPGLSEPLANLGVVREMYEDAVRRHEAADEAAAAAAAASGAGEGGRGGGGEAAAV